jgi:hypothetical protein
VLYLQLIILSVGDDVPINIDSKTLLVIDFVNLKIKLIQSFRYDYMNRMCIFI